MGKEAQNKSPTDDAVVAISVSHLVNPTLHFSHPNDVLAANHLDIPEKRAILASWASDRFAVESIPALRPYPGTEMAVAYDEILNALKALDRDQRNDLGSSCSDNYAMERLNLRSFLPARPRSKRSS
jgi:hypothetical protein